MDLADHLCHDVFVRIIEALPDYDERGLPVEAWMYRIAHDRAVDAIRRMARRPAVPIEAHHAISADPTSVPDDALQQALNRLSAEQRQIILLRYCDEYSVSEIAQLLGRSEGSIKQLRNRGMVALRRTYHTVSSA